MLLSTDSTQSKHPCNRMQTSDNKILRYIYIMIQIEIELCITTNLYVILKLNCRQMRVSYIHTLLKNIILFQLTHELN